MRSASVYVVINAVDGKIYVGKAVDPEKRWQSHTKAAQKGYESFLCRAIRKHGIDNFEFSVVETYGSEDEAFEAETLWIRALRELGFDLYNLNDGGLGGGTPSAETRAKMSANSASRRPEVREKIAATLRGRKFSEEHRAKLSENNASKRPEVAAKIATSKRGGLNPMKRHEVAAKVGSALRGRTVPEETRAKMSAANLGQKRSEETRAKIRAARRGRKLSDIGAGTPRIDHEEEESAGCVDSS